MNHPQNANPGLDKEKLEFLSPLFEEYLKCLLNDGEKIRNRAWQALALVAGIITLLVSVTANKWGELPWWVISFLAAQAAALVWLSWRLSKKMFWGSPVCAPGENPSGWLKNDEVCNQSLDSMMAVHCYMIMSSCDLARDRLIKATDAHREFLKGLPLSPVLALLVTALISAVAHIPG